MSTLYKLNEVKKEKHSHFITIFVLKKTLQR